jgi:DNA-binding transcriptional ArsR family regulator
LEGLRAARDLWRLVTDNDRRAAPGAVSSVSALGPGCVKTQKLFENGASKDGVCAILIAEKLGITQATLSEHMRVLVETGMVKPKRIKQWIFYRRNEQAIARLKSEILDKI